MRIRIGFDIIHVCPQPTPMVLTLSVHHSRVSDLEHPDLLITEPAVPLGWHGASNPKGGTLIYVHP